ncbi:hypothetical protein A1O3_02443 [Capronia epimyces CBS 606.96]|uniref:RNA helicase n=1 Tax=Capronia epimyces CBS 606.96 TaxID=1182542 RepID=W9YJH1_9EURO|nr:uncharacterized protein A1O3_02443 [Capronia epimyces CBS 606.96]EXJ89376.1 hypothetical protein A1O3_02443 [Capronia epimyces CBS 606.96]
MAPKGKKRSATEAFHAPPKPNQSKSMQDTLHHHRSRSAQNGHGGSGRVVSFTGRGQDGDDGDDDNLETPSTMTATATSTPQHKPHGRASLKERARQLQAVRQQLPIYSHAEHIRQKLRDHDVLLLVGETGSGKSTQIPQFLVHEPWCQKRQLQLKVDGEVGVGVAVGGCIAITQPRRVAAISLARRVAEEMGTPLGSASPASLVGYSVRFENSTSPSTRVKFLTEGMLLQEMLRDPWLKQYSAVVVDEVHERGVNVDLVLGFLRRMQDLRGTPHDGRAGVPIKVVVMSATADMDRIRDFFNLQHQTAHAGPDQTQNNAAEAAPAPEQEQEQEWSGFSDGDDGNSKPHSTQSKPGTHKDLSNKATTTTSLIPPATTPNSRATSLFIKGRQHAVTINYTPTPVPDILDAAYQRIVHIHSHSPLPGDILVFLTGQETVESLLSLLTSWAASVQKDVKLAKQLPRLLVLPLYAALPSNLQQRVFQATPKFTRKIILATNIAETSITVPGIRHVIDTGKAKQRLFRPSLNLDTLLTVPISRSSANQRAGRAGRDGPGTAYRLYTESDFYQLSQDTEPEILRCDLSQLVLTLKAHGIDNLHQFPFLTAPPRRALERAMIHLIQLAVLDTATGRISPLGRDMGGLPLPASLARVLLASAEPEFDCVDEIIDIVSALSVENVFLNIHHSQMRQRQRQPNSDPLKAGTKKHDGNGDDEDEFDGDGDGEETREGRAERNRRALFRREGDHLTLLATMQAYAAEQTDRRRWCEERFISHRAMNSAMDVRKQLTALMGQREKARSKGKGKGTAESRRGKVEGEGKGKETETETDKDTEATNTNTTHDPTTLPSRVLKCILTGFHANVARLSPDGSYRTILTNQAVAIHPSSVLFSVPGSGSGSGSGSSSRGSGGGGGGARAGGRGGGGGGVGGDGLPRQKFEGIVYNEFVYTGTKAYARGVSAVEMRWVAEVLKR